MGKLNENMKTSALCYVAKAIVVSQDGARVTSANLTETLTLISLDSLLKRRGHYSDCQSV